MPPKRAVYPLAVPFNFSSPSFPPPPPSPRQSLIYFLKIPALDSAPAGYLPGLCFAQLSVFPTQHSLPDPLHSDLCSQHCTEKSTITHWSNSKALPLLLADLSATGDTATCQMVTKVPPPLSCLRAPHLLPVV